MIEISLVKDEANYPREQLDIMEEVFNRSFISSEGSEGEMASERSYPETQIHVKFTTGVVPGMLFTALGDDLSDLVADKEFFKAFASPKGSQTPSLVFVFEGGTRSFHFRIRSKSKKSLKEGSKKAAEKLLSVLAEEDTAPNSHDRHVFLYNRGEWAEASE